MKKESFKHNMDSSMTNPGQLLHDCQYCPHYGLLLGIETLLPYCSKEGKLFTQNTKLR